MYLLEGFYFSITWVFGLLSTPSSGVLFSNLVLSTLLLRLRLPRNVRDGDGQSLRGGDGQSSRGGDGGTLVSGCG